MQKQRERIHKNFRENDSTWLNTPENRALEFVSQSKGQPLDTATRAAIEPQFAHNFADVRVHTDLEAATVASGVEARAFTVGRDVVFNAGEYQPESLQGQALLAHELTHTVQNQKHNTQAAQQLLSQSGTSSEFEAHSATQQFQNREPVQIGVAPSSTIQRFGSLEHKLLGDLGSGGKMTDINIGTDAAPELLSYGDMVALAGDHFKSIEQIRKLTESQAGKDEIRYARWKALRKDMGEAKPNVDPAIAKKVEDDYLLLAADNTSHFSAGGTAKNHYQQYHSQALDKAFEAGQKGDAKLMAQATTTEAFGHHYLTDMFSAGHVRTPRIALKEWYKAHFSDSIEKFKQYMAQDIRRFLEGDTPGYKRKIGKTLRWLDTDVIGGGDAHTLPDDYKFPTEGDLEKKIEDLAGPVLKTFSLGDIVALAMHNTDNQGLNVVSDVDANGSDVLGGYSYRAVGDGQLKQSLTSSSAEPQAGEATRDMALAAIRASLGELEQVRAAGARAAGLTIPDRVNELHQSAIDVLHDGEGRFAAERYIPREDTSTGNGNVQFKWEWGAFNAEMRAAVDEAVKDDITDEVRNKAADQEGQVKKALEHFAEQLNIWGIAVLEWAVDKPAGG